MGKLFDIVKNEVQLNPDILAVPIFNSIWSRDKGRGKPMANKELKYIVFLVDYRSPYKDLAANVREKTIRKDIFGPRSKWFPDDIILDAIEKYKQLQKTRHMRLLESVFKTEESITDYFENIDMNKTDDFGKPLYTMENIIRNMEKVGNVILSISKLEKQVQSELADLSVRGGNEIGYYENPESVNDLIN